MRVNRCRRVFDVTLTELPVPSVADPLPVLQEFYDQFRPGGSVPDRRYDSYQVQYSPLDLAIEGRVEIIDRSTNGAPEGHADFRAWPSRLRTAQPYKRPATQKESLLALIKRNMNVDELRGPVDPDTFVEFAVDKFFDTFATPNWRVVCDNYQRDFIAGHEALVTDWILNQSPEKRARIECTGEPLTLRDLREYYFEIKRDPKNKLEIGAENEYQALQTIVHHKPRVNAVFSSMFRQISERLEGLLLPNVLVMQRKNYDQIESFMNRCLDPSEVYNILENDFSKFDKSQEYIALMVEYEVYRRLGFDELLLEAWKDGHFDTRLTDYNAGFRAFISFQRKSGEATTLLGNTIVQMVAIAYAYKDLNFDMAAFVGDDSAIFSRGLFDFRDATNQMALAFNLDAKIIVDMGYAYFCSAFLINTHNRFVFVPDPLKKVERLSKSIQFKDGSSFEAEAKERWVSFADSMRRLSDYAVYEPLKNALVERYPPAKEHHIATFAFAALHELAVDFKKFKKLYVV